MAPAVAVYGALDRGLHARGRGVAEAPPPYEVIIVAERGEAGLAHFFALWHAQPLSPSSLCHSTVTASVTYGDSLHYIR